MKTYSDLIQLLQAKGFTAEEAESLCGYRKKTGRKIRSGKKELIWDKTYRAIR